MKKLVQKKGLWVIIFMLMAFAGFNQTKWRFAVLGDTHTGNSDTVAEMIPYMLADSIDCVLICGDIVNGGLDCDSATMHQQLLAWKNIFMPLYEHGIGIYPVRGNHEDDASYNITIWNEVFSGPYSMPQNGPEGELNLTYSFNHKNALFIGLDEYVNIHKVNQDWLNQQLSLNTQPNVFVFGHEAAFKVFHADCLDDSLSARNIFWQSLSQARVKAYFCGHDHFLDVAKVNDTDNDTTNDVYQYLVGTGGGWLMSQYSNYNGINSPYSPNRVFHEKYFGYALVEVSGEGPGDCNYKVTFKKRVWNSQNSTFEFIPTTDILNLNGCPLSLSDDADNLNSINVCPNPVSENCTVSFNKEYAQVKVEIFDIMANKVKELNMTSATIVNIDMRDFQPGVYLMNISFDNKCYSKKIIKI